MNRRSVASLFGFIRLASKHDCIRIAVFRESGMNFDLIAETDGNLRITRFLDLYPEQGYQVDELPAKVRRRYSIGDAAPIPFLVSQTPIIISGDRQPLDVDGAVPVTARQSDVVKDVRNLLANARSGFFRQRLEDWKAEEIRTVYADVFTERPSNSRYWVARYRSSIVRSKRNEVLPMSLADDIRNVGTRWLQLFATKTDFGRIRLLFNDVDDGVFSRGDLVSSAFAHLCHKYTKRDFRLLKRIFSGDAYCLGLLPGGLYYHYIEHGYPDVPFRYDKPDNFLSEFRTKLYRASETGDLKDAKSLALVLFGLKDTPNELQNELTRLRVRLTHDFVSAKEEETRRVSWIKYEGKDDFILEGDGQREYDIVIQNIVTTFDALVDLEAIEYGNARLAPRSNDFLAAERGYVDKFRSMLDVH